MLNRSEVRRRGENQNNVDSRIGRYIRGEISATCLVNCPWRKSYKKSHKYSAADYDTAHRSRQQHVTADKMKYKIRPPFRNTINVKNTSFVSMVDDLKRLKLDDSKSSSRSALKSSSKISKISVKEDKSHFANSHRKLDALAVANDRVNEAFKRAPMEIGKSLQANFSDSAMLNFRGRAPKIRHSVKKPSVLEGTIVNHDNNEFIGQTPVACVCLADPDVDSFCMCQDEVLKRIIPEPGVYLKEIKKKLSRFRNTSSTNKSVVSPVLSFYSSHNEEPANFEYWQCN